MLRVIPAVGSEFIMLSPSELSLARFRIELGNEEFVILGRNMRSAMTVGTNEPFCFDSGSLFEHSELLVSGSRFMVFKELVFILGRLNVMLLPMYREGGNDTLHNVFM